MNTPLFFNNVIKTILFCGLFFVFQTFEVRSQELNCTVEVNTDRLEGSSFQYLNKLKPDIENYLNEYNWTDADFQDHERIECLVQIVILSGTSNYLFSAETVIQVRRPIYNTTNKTSTLLLSDNGWQFSYPEGRTMIHDELQFDDLTGFLDFYAYIILGYDFDTFSELGGSEYFVRAQNILNLAQTTNAAGWSRNSNNQRNRNTLVSDLTSGSYNNLRRAYYSYHRQGLDRFIDSPDLARQQILTTMESIQAAKRRSTSNWLYDIFFDTKAREIAGIFQSAPRDVRLEAYNILRQTDQGHLSEYESLQN